MKLARLTTEATARAARPANRGGEITRDRILDAAERLFSGHGIDGVSMRDLAAEGKTTLALANYHFGSKDGVYRAVFERRIAAVSAARRDGLAQVLGRAGPPASIAEILDAMVRPWVELRSRPGGLAYTRLAAREAGDPAEGGRGIIAELLDPISREFMAALRRALPALPPQRVDWAYHFVMGSLLLILANPARVKRLSGRTCTIDDDDAVVREIVDFFAPALGGSPLLFLPQDAAPSKARAAKVAPTVARRTASSTAPAEPAPPIPVRGRVARPTKPKGSARHVAGDAAQRK